MFKHINGFLTWWYEGLLNPWRGFVKIQSVQYDSVNHRIHGVTNTRRRYFLEIPYSQVLSASIPSNLVVQDHKVLSQEPNALESLVAQALPFSASEVFATIEDKMVVAVLKNDIKDALSAASKQNVALLGLTFSVKSQATYIPFNDTDQKSRLPTVFAFALIALFIAGFVFLDSSIKKAELLLRDNSTTLSLLNATESPQPTNQLITIAGVSPDQILNALRSVTNTLTADTSLEQISLEHREPFLVMIIDAQSTSAAAQLTSFEKAQFFSNTEFVSAISSDRDGSIERYRLTTYFQLSDKKNSLSAHND